MIELRGSVISLNMLILPVKGLFSFTRHNHVMDTSVVTVSTLHVYVCK